MLDKILIEIVLVFYSVLVDALGALRYLKKKRFFVL